MSDGTVTDWHSTIVREGERLGCDKRITVDWRALCHGLAQRL